MAGDLAALRDHRVLYLGAWRNVVRRHAGVAAVNLPAGVVKIHRHLGIQQVHIGLPQAIDGADILPVALEGISH